MSLCASGITSFLLINILQLPCWNCLELFPFLVRCCICILNFDRRWHRNKLVNQIVMGHRSKSFACNVFFVNTKLRRFHSLPCGFVIFHFSTINRFGNLLGCSQFPALQPHGGCHRSLRSVCPMNLVFARHVFPVFTSRFFF